MINLCGVYTTRQGGLAQVEMVNQFSAEGFLTSMPQVHMYWSRKTGKDLLHESGTYDLECEAAGTVAPHARFGEAERAWD
jgi:hypothetical protein